MSVEPIWFGSSEHPLFGWLHVPEDRRARGAIVCCPSLGTEAVSSYRALRHLASVLETAGFLTLRFDYVGTGDSAGEGGEDEGVEGWRQSIRQALQLVRRMAPVPVGLIGLRLGATLAAAEAADDGSIEAVALWDPCGNGRAFLREQRALKAMSIGGATGGGASGTGSVELLGWVAGPAKRRELEELNLEGVELPLARRCLVLVREDRPVGPLLSRWRAEPSVDWKPARGQSELIEVLPNDSKVPWATLETLTRWFDQVMPAPRASVTVRAQPETVIRAPGSVAVRERALRLGKVGLFAIATEPLVSNGRATVVFLNAGIIHHIGPARLWVTLARRLAGQGLNVVRLDLSGLGDSPVRDGQTPHLVHPLEAMDDIRIALDAMGLAADRVVVAGLCSGAYHAIEAGLRIPLRGVCAVNPILAFDPPEVKAGGPIADDRHAVAQFNGWIKRLRRFSALAYWGEYRAPRVMWWLLDRTGVQPHPARGFEELARRRIPVALICGEVEARPFLRRAWWSFQALIRSGDLVFDLLEDIDHTLFGASARARATELMIERLGKLATSDSPASDRTPVAQEKWSAGAGLDPRSVEGHLV
jgi:alpha-beta hydrolase superfamily lysophospholipase